VYPRSTLKQLFERWKTVSVEGEYDLVVSQV